MFTKNDVLDLMKQDLKEMKENVRVSEVKIEQFLSRFEDLDKFLIDTQYIVNYYFNNQTKYTNINEFKNYIKIKLSFYINSFSMNLEDRLKIDDELEEIEETFDKLIYFWEHNPVQARKEMLKQEKTSWFVW